MENRNDKFYFIECILQMSRLLESKHIDMDQFLEGNFPSGLFSAEEERELQAAMDWISFMDQIPGGFFIYYNNDKEELIHANRSVLRMFLCDTYKEFRELTGNSFKGLVYPEDLDMVEQSIREQILSNQYDFDYVEYRIRRKDGTIDWIDDYGHLVHCGPAGELFFVFLGKPSDERLNRQAQQMEQLQALTTAFEKADLAVKAKNAFLSQISHEMRTPLNAIFGFLTLAQISLQEPEAIEDYLNQIETASHQLLNMITQALDVSALSNASVDFTEDECNLCDTLQEVYDFLLPQAQEKGLVFSLKYEKLVHQNVYTVSERLRQMILNLINNAITYTRSGGTVEIILTEEKILPDNYSVYQLKVMDTGIGIEESFLERIFEPFSRESTSTLSGIQGIGLGLTIVKSIVDLLGGAISVKSTVNEGSTFTVTLPFQVISEDSAQQKSSSRLHILLAEDNELDREVETELLERQGFIIDPVENGQIAFEKIKGSSPGDYDLILMDLKMPKMNGWELAAAVRSLPDPALAHIPIIVLSANIQFEDRRRSLESGIDVHLSKPMNFNLLLETIKKCTKK